MSAASRIDSLYLVAYLLFGAAAAHPSMRVLTDPHPVPVTWLGPVRMVCLAAAMVTGPILVALGPEAAGGLVVVAVGTALLSLLVLARLAGLVGVLARDVAQRRALEAQLSFQAFHDPLTGLTNRRRFVEAAEAALADPIRDGVGRRPVPRPRRLQDGQRQPRSRGRRRRCSSRSPTACAVTCGPRISLRGSAATSSACC